MRRYLPYLLIAIAFAVLCFKSVGTIPFVDPDEPRYAGAAREMAEGGSWLIPEFNGRPRINKPPLFYWLTAVSMKLCGGASELSGRLPSIAMGLLMLAVTIALGRRLFGRQVGVVAGAALVTTPLYFVLARTCVTDMTFSAFLTLALAAIAGFVVLPRDPTRSRRLAIVFVIAFGLAVLTKATPALVVVFVVFADLALVPTSSQTGRTGRSLLILLALAAVFSYGREFVDADDSPRFAGVLAATSTAMLVAVAAIGCVRAIRSSERVVWRGVPGSRLLVLGLLVGAWWYVAIAIAQGWDRFAELLRFEIGARLEGSVHREGVYYFVIILPLITLPWSLALPAALRRAYASARSRVNGEERADAFLLAWVVGALLFFSIPGGKLITYILPVIPAVTLLVARYIVAMRDEREAAGQRLTRSLLRGFTFACTVLAAALFFRGSNLGDDIPSREIAYAAAFLAAGTWFGWKRILAGAPGLGAGIVATGIVIAISIGIHAAASELELRSQRAFAKELSSTLAPYDRILSRGVRIESFTYYLDKPVTDLTDLSREGSMTERIEGELRASPTVAIVLKGSAVKKILKNGLALPAAWPADARIIAQTDDAVVVARPPALR